MGVGRGGAWEWGMRLACGVGMVGGSKGEECFGEMICDVYIRAQLVWGNNCINSKANEAQTSGLQ